MRDCSLQSENLLAVAEAKVETSRISKEITLLSSNPRSVRATQATNLVRTATTEIKTALTYALVPDLDLLYLVNHPNYTLYRLGWTPLPARRPHSRHPNLRRYTLCQRVGHQRDSCESQVPRYSVEHLIETVPWFETVIDAFTRKLNGLETNATIQLLRRQRNFKGSHHTNQYRFMRHLCSTGDVRQAPS